MQLKQPCASWDRAHVIQPAESGRAGRGVPAPQESGHPGLTSVSMRRRKELPGWEYLSYPIMNVRRYQGSISGNGGIPEGGYFFPLKFTQAAQEPLDGLECSFTNFIDLFPFKVLHSFLLSNLNSISIM